MKKGMISRICWVLGVIAGFIGAYFLWSNIILFDHDIGAWVAENCTLVAAVVSVAAACFNKKWIASFVFVGYNLGVIAGGLFGKISYDPGGGTLHNGWRIWIFVFIGCALIGCIAEDWAQSDKTKGA